MKRTARNMVALGRVWAELGSGNIWEGFIASDRTKYVEGFIEGNQITVNPAPNVVDSLIHEIVHRMHPEWGETYVRRETTLMMRSMTDTEIQAFYEEFQRRRRKRRTVKRTSE
jgi:hypothetical protein